MAARDYEIRVRGVAGATTRSAFAEFDVATDGDDSILLGAIPDQAALFGVLDRLQRLGIELLEVRIRPDDAAAVSSLEDDGDGRRTEAVPVLVVKGRRSCRTLVRTLVDTQPDLAVIGEAATLGEALGAGVRPRVVLTDLDLADASGRALVDAVRDGFEGCALVVQSASATSPELQAVLATGVEGVLTHDATAAELLLAVRSAARGRTYLQPSAAAALVHSP